MFTSSYNQVSNTFSISRLTAESTLEIGLNMYGLCKVHKDIINNCPLFQPILSTINTPTYKLANLLF